MADDKKPSIFQKVIEAGSAMLDAQIAKSKNSLEKKDEYSEADFEFGKAVTRDRSYYLGSQGFQEKPGALSYEYQKQMAVKSSIVSAIIKTRQNRVSTFSEYVPEGNKPGFKIRLKHESEQLEEIMDELFGMDQEGGDEAADTSDETGFGGEDAQESTGDGLGKSRPLRKAQKPPKKPAKKPAPGQEGDVGGDGEDLDIAELGDFATATEEEVPEEAMSEEDMMIEAKKELEKRTRKKKRDIAEFLLHCGEVEDRPFESKKWTLDAYLRALIWDSLTYDQAATELVPKEAEILDGKLNIHHFYPVDGSTIRYASPELAKYKNVDMQMAQDILYPEEELKAMEERDTLELDQVRLERNEYKYVQLIRGRIQRGFTQDELKVGMRNPTSDIYVNGYSISELEMLVALVTSHLQTEFYNRSYFQQGFSAKGILHIKANLNRSKLEELRRNWNHMVKGNKNSFQTPIMAGMDEVQWIPLTQSHSEMEFSMWLNYLIRMICAIYQIDPSEIGYGIKDEGRGGGLSGDNTKEKLQNSKDKGFVPLMKFVQDYMNKNIVEIIDPDYMLEWTGLEDESSMSRIARQKEEVQWKKTLNEVRAEDGLPPIKGADHLILNPVYFNWLSQMSEEGQELQAQRAEQALAAAGPDGMGAGGENPEGDQKNWEAEQAGAENDHARNIEGKMLDHGNKMEQIKASSKSKGPVKKSKPLAKALRVEVYRLDR